MNNTKNNQYDVAILGGGVVGTAILYVLSKYTTLESIALLEKYPKLGQVNSNSRSNSQTLHFGDIETNYPLEKAKVVKGAAEMVVRYLEGLKDKKSKIFQKGHKMVLGVGEKEVNGLEKRFGEFKRLFPNLKKLGVREIAKVEPEVVKGRNPKEPILALYSKDSYTVDFGRLAESFVENSLKETKKNIDVFLDTKVKSIKKNRGIYEISTNDQTISAKVVIVALGAHSLLFAKSLDYGKEYLILPVVGNFYSSCRKILNGKVYTVQQEKLPFAAVHGDPVLGKPNETRFGPTAKVLPVLERRDITTFPEFIKSTGIDFRAVTSLFKIISDKVILKFIIKNLIYDVPLIGKKLFLEAVRKIVPTIKDYDCEFGKGLGGIRPQLVHKKEKRLLLGEAEIIGENIIFNVTPSPGATSCLKAAEKTTKKIMDFFAGAFKFDEKRFKSNFSQKTFSREKISIY